MKLAADGKIIVVGFTLPIVERMIKDMNRDDANLWGWWAYEGKLSFYSFRIIDCPGLNETLNHDLWGEE